MDCSHFERCSKNDVRIYDYVELEQLQLRVYPYRPLNMHIHPQRSELEKISASALAEALLQLSINDDLARSAVERLLASPKENMERFKAKLKQLKHSQEQYTWEQADSFALELESFLWDLEAGSPDPRTGVELVGSFFQADANVFERCGCDGGSVSMVFTDNAFHLFRSYAQRCEDKEWLAEYVQQLVRNDCYGIRDCLITE